MLPLNHKCKHATMPQGVARCEIKSLPQEGKHVHKLLPEVLLQKGKHEIETLPRKGKLEVGTLLQGCTNKGDRKASWPL